MRRKLLLCSTTPSSNMRSNIDNIIVKITYNDKNWTIINGLNNIMIELKRIMGYISTSFLFAILKEEFLGKYYYDIKDTDRQQMTSDSN